MLLLEDKMFNIMNNLDLAEYDEFGPNADEDSAEECARFIALAIAPKDLPDAVICSGASRIVAILPNSSVVLKIPFSGYYYTDWYTQKEMFNSFSGSEEFGDEYREEGNWFNYCDYEMELYDEIKNYNMEQIYSKLKFLGCTPGGYPCYIQEKVVPLKQSDVCIDRNSPSYKSTKRLREKFDIALCLPEVWITKAVEYYGVEFMDKFFDFVDNHCEYFDDIHSGNLGYSALDGRPLVIDYAGYYED